MSVSGASISAGSIVATPTATSSRSRSSAASASRRGSGTRFESSMSAGSAAGSARTAAATIGPSTGPFPASSAPTRMSGGGGAGTKAFPLLSGTAR